MGTLNDEILRATGGPTVQDGLTAFYNASGIVLGGAIEDLERKYLLFSIVGTPPAKATNQDLWRIFFAEGAFVGTYNDQQLQFWTSK